MGKHIISNKEGRERWLERTLSSLPAGSRILDAGAGELQYRRFCNHLDYVSQDFGGYDGEGSGVGLQTGAWDTTEVDIVGDITDIPEPDGAFDAIMCVEVLEHLPDPNSAISEFSRLLKPGGKLILTAPVSSLTHFAPYYYYNGFSRYYYENQLNKYSFKLDELVHNGNYFDYMYQEVGRFRKVARDYSKIGLFGRLWLRVIGGLLRMQLRRLSRVDAGSEELLCFGIHVVATKENEGVSG